MRISFYGANTVYDAYLYAMAVATAIMTPPTIRPVLNDALKNDLVSDASFFLLELLNIF